MPERKNIMTCEESRKLFPYLQTDLKYFNHAAIGPLSSRVTSALDEYIMQRSTQYVENYFETLPQYNNAKKRIARMLNVEKKNVAWTDNVSNALNLLAQGIAWQKGDQIILNDLEFPSNVYPFLNLVKKGVEVKFAINDSGKVDLEQIEKQVSPRTRLVSISLVQFLTGYRADVIQIGEFCRENDIIFCVDGIQGAGVVEINPIQANIDFFVGGTQKWLMGLQGTSYFYISQALHEKLIPSYVGWTSVQDAWNLTDYKLELIESADRYQNGTLSRIGIIAADASLSLFEEVGYDKIEKKVISNSKYLINQFRELGFNPILEGVPDKNLAGIVSFKHEAAAEIVDNLKKNNIVCSLRESMVRISPHFYNNAEELEYLIYTLKNIKK